MNEKIEKTGVWYKFGNTAFIKDDDGNITELPAVEISNWLDYEDGELPDQNSGDLIKRWSDNVANNFLKGLE